MLALTSARRVAYATLAVSLMAAIASAVLQALSDGFGEDPAFEVGLYLAFGSFMVMGSVIVSQRPENAVGWLFSAIGLVIGVGSLAQAYSVYALITRPGSIPGGVLMAWVAALWWWLFVGLVTVFVPLLFPTGHLLSRRWRPVLWLAMAQVGAAEVLVALDPRLEISAEVSVPNPIGVVAVGNIEESPAGQAVLGVLLLLIAFSVVSLILRFRGSRGEERQQLKWFTLAGMLLVVWIFVDGFAFPDGAPTDLPFAITVGFLPVAAGIAVVKYRLYEIDRIINRTLVYGVLTGLLALAYWGLAATLGGMVRAITGTESNDLVVAASTLAVAGLFGPLRKRVQGFVDRKFYRRRYDAVRILEDFSAGLRDEVDLSGLGTELVGVVRETLQPASVALWLREEWTAR